MRKLLQENRSIMLCMFSQFCILNWRLGCIKLGEAMWKECQQVPWVTALPAPLSCIRLRVLILHGISPCSAEKLSLAIQEAWKVRGKLPWKCWEGWGLSFCAYLSEGSCCCSATCAGLVSVHMAEWESVRTWRR